MKGTEKGLGSTNVVCNRFTFFCCDFGGLIFDFGVRVLETDADA